MPQFSIAVAFLVAVIRTNIEAINFAYLKTFTL